ncbi:hypothetical protein ACHAPT_009371 [Fusarium lateritium]
MPLLSLPDEVLREIAAVLPGKDLKTLRLACRRLCQNTSPFLFETLYLSCHSLDLEVFRIVAQNPLLLGGVRQLVIDDTTVSPSLLNAAIFRTMASINNLWPNRAKPYFSTEPFDNDDREWSTGPDQDLWHLLVDVYQHHHTNRALQLDVQALRAALPGMRSLRSLVLSNRTADDTPLEGAQSQTSASPVVRMWRDVGHRRGERPPFAPRCDWGHPLQGADMDDEATFDMNYLVDYMRKHLLLNAPAYSHLVGPAQNEAEESENDDAVHSEDGEHEAPENVEVQGVNHPMLPTWVDDTCRLLRREARGLGVALVVLADPRVRSQLKEFRIDASLDTILPTQTPGISIRLFDFFAPPFTSRLCSAFSASYLTKFHIVLANGLRAEDGEAILNQGQIRCILSSMPRLEDLMIEAHSMSTIGAIPGLLVFRHLRRASFLCGLVGRHEIRDFVVQHGSTLQHLHIGYSSLDDENEEPDWEVVVQDLTNLQLTGVVQLRTASIISGYASIPPTGCGRNKTKTPPNPDEPVLSWTLGTDEAAVPTPREELGHVAPPDP